MNRRRVGGLSLALLVAAMGGIARGQIFVTNAGAGTVAAYDTAGNLLNDTLISGLKYPTAITTSGGYLLVNSALGGAIGEYTVAGTTVNASLITGLSFPGDMAVSGSNLFIVNAVAGSIGEYTLGDTPGTIASSTPSLITGLSNPYGIAVSGADLFVINNSGQSVAEYTTAGAAVNMSLITVSGGTLTGIAAAGPNLFVTNDLTGDIGEYTTGGATVNASLITGPPGYNQFGLAVSGTNLFAVNLMNAAVGEYTTAGATVNTSLISGISPPAGIVVVSSLPFTWTGAASNNWDTSAVNFSAGDSGGSGGGSPSAWANSPNRTMPNAAIFNLATAASVSVNADIDVGGITFATGGWTLNFGSGALAYGADGAIQMITAAGADTITAPIVDGKTFGSGGGITSLAKSGPGTLILGGNNAYSGNTSITAGTLVIAAEDALPSGTAVANAGTLLINAATTIGPLTGAGATTVAASASLTAGSITQAGLAINGNAAVTIASAPLLTGPGNRNPDATISVLGALNIAGGAAPGGTLNLNNNALIIANGGAAARDAATADIAYARNGGLWNQPGITSSTAQSAYAATHFDSQTLGVVLNSDLPNPYTTFGGQPVGPNDVLIAFTYGGDADLNGTINSDDYFQIDRGFLDHYSGWVNGDFNYDGTVNGLDYFIIDSNFIDQSGQLAASEVLAHAAEFGPSYLAQFTPSQLAIIGVPEPTSLLLLAVGATGLLARRARRAKR